MPQRNQPPALHLEQIKPIVAQWDRALDPIALTRLQGGSSAVYRIDFAGDAPPIVLKTYYDQPVWNPAKEALVAGWLKPHLGAFVPAWLMVDETRTHVPVRVALTSWLPGKIVRDLLSEPDIEDVYRQMGALLRRVHEMAMDGYGYIVGDGIHQLRATNAEYMPAAFADAFRQFRAHGADETLARRLEAIAESQIEVLGVSAGPVFCHDDFQQGNLLAARNEAGALALTGLIDFGNARAGDALMDLAKTLFCATHEDPRSAAPILAGYGPVNHPDPETALWLYTMFHRLTMWWFLRSIGQQPETESLSALMRDLTNMADDRC